MALENEAGSTVKRLDPGFRGAHFNGLEDQFVKSVSIMAKVGVGEVGAERCEQISGI